MAIRASARSFMRASSSPVWTEAPVHLAVFVDEATSGGHGLVRATMSETARYSVVTAVHTLWLAARARGVGGSVGCRFWMPTASRGRSIRRPFGRWWRISAPAIPWKSKHIDPELQRHGWQGIDARARSDQTLMASEPGIHDSVPLGAEVFSGRV